MKKGERQLIQVAAKETPDRLRRKSFIVRMERHGTEVWCGCGISILRGGQSLTRQGPEQLEGTFEFGLFWGGRLGFMLQRSLPD